MREIAPAALRCQFLDPGPGKGPWITGGITGGVGAGAAIALAVLYGVPLLAVAAPVIGAVIGAMAASSSGPLESLKDLRAAAVNIVPWGIVIDPDGKPEPTPWARIRGVRYRLVKRDRHEDQYAPKMAILIFEIGSNRIQAMGQEGEWVISVCELHRQLAKAAATPPAADLAETTPLDLTGLPAPLALARRAEAILDSADGRATLGLEAGGYRTSGSRFAGLETRAALREALFHGEAPFDPGPLACLLAAQLGVGSLLPDLLQLILSPSPLLAVVARAAAVRLGASLMQAGALEEVRYFVPPEDIAELKDWLRRAA